MRYIFQLAVILGISLLGELLNQLIPLPIPGSIYGLALMLLALLTGLVRLEQVEGAGRFLIEIMPVMFIPAAVGLMASWDQLQSMLIPAVVIMVISTFAVMAAAGLATQAAMRRKARRGKEDEA